MSTSKNTKRLIINNNNGICTITMNRPAKRNALSRNLLGDLQDAFNLISNNNTIKVIVLAANGPVFSSGHDLKEMRKNPDSNVMYELFSQCSALMLTMKKQPQPIIAKVDGAAMAAGLQLMSNCDLAVASSNSKFALPGSAIGLFCSSPAVPVSRVANPKHTMEMLLTGKAFNAEDAYRFGLINKVVPAEKIDDAVMDYATIIVSRSRITTALGKIAFYEQLDMKLEEAYKFTSEVMAKNMQEVDALEGIEAFLEKRDAKWKDG